MTTGRAVRANSGRRRSQRRSTLSVVIATGSCRRRSRSRAADNHIRSIIDAAMPAIDYRGDSWSASSANTARSDLHRRAAGGIPRHAMARDRFPAQPVNTASSSTKGTPHTPPLSRRLYISTEGDALGLKPKATGRAPPRPSSFHGLPTPVDDNQQTCTSRCSMTRIRGRRRRRCPRSSTTRMLTTAPRSFEATDHGHPKLPSGA